MDQSDDPEVALEKMDDARLLRECLKRLPPKQREVIDLVYYHEKSVNEVAEIIGVPCSTVKTRMFYARQRIAELFKEATMLAAGQSGSGSSDIAGASSHRQSARLALAA